MVFPLGMAADAATLHSLSHPRHQSKETGSESEAFPTYPSPCALSNYVTYTMNLNTASFGVAEFFGLTGGGPEVSHSQDTNYRQLPKSVEAATPTRESNRRQRSSSKTKTSFQIAHPPPVLRSRQRLNIRPRILLQLQQISQTSRPIPVLDVVPSVIFAPNLARRFPKVFKGKDGLGADDLVVVNSQTYTPTPSPSRSRLESSSEEDRWDSREVVAAICQNGRRGTTEIALNHGETWEATRLPNGAYEFVSEDSQGNSTVARWVPKHNMGKHRPANTHNAPSPPSIEDKRFSFSLIDPRSRRHPVIANLCHQSLDILDEYCLPEDLNDIERPQFARPSNLRSNQANELHESTKRTIQTDEQLRTLIIVTSVWVTFREGFSPNFQYKNLSVSNSRAVPLGRSRRSLSLDITPRGSGGSAYTNSKAQAQAGSQSRNGVIHSSSTSTVPTISSPIFPAEGPKRTYSTGAAFLQRANNRNGLPAGNSGYISRRDSGYGERSPPASFSPPAQPGNGQSLSLTDCPASPQYQSAPLGSGTPDEIGGLPESSRATYDTNGRRPKRFSRFMGIFRGPSYDR